jgi:hypothetical protein
LKKEQNKEQVDEQKLIYSGGLGLSSRLVKRIHCRLIRIPENGTPEILVIKKVPYGKRIFKWKGQVYNIDYNLLKHGKRHFEYDHEIDNSIGGLAYVKNQDRISPNQLDEFMEGLGENVFTARRGIPAMVLYIALIVALIGVGGLVYFAMEYATNTSLIEQYVRENTNLKATIQTLQNQLNNRDLG